MGSEWMIVVWERRNKVGKWCQYSAEVCHLLEQSYTKNLTSVCLGDVDSDLKSFTVNLKDMAQTSEATGTTREVQRLLCDESYTNAEQVMWQWRGDSQNSWHSYSVSLATCIEDAYKSECESVDLSKMFQSYPYIVNFGTMCQVNKKSRFHRPIKRIHTSSYPRVKIENGIEIQSSSNMYMHCNNLLSATASEAASSAAPRKKALVKRISDFWNKLVKTDSETFPDGASPSESAKKKQCLPQKTRESQGATSLQSQSAETSVNSLIHKHGIITEQRHEYATVNGKPWKQPWPPHTPQSEVKPVPGIKPLQDTNEKGRKSRRKGSSPASSPELDVISEYTEILEELPAAENSEEQICIICYEKLSNTSSYDDDATLIKLQQCSHIFHRSCIKAMYESGTGESYLQCPSCKSIHGVKLGIQPAGTMVYHVLPYSLPGYSECDTIRIIYDIRQGIQGPEHPHPGERYSARGFPRHCYLPDNDIGRRVLRLLIKAWERGLIFTIGSSSTTGEQNTVTWNDIHHKTEFGYSRRGHGYPDNNYFDNVMSELAAQGVTESTYEWFPA